MYLTTLPLRVYDSHMFGAVWLEEGGEGKVTNVRRYCRPQQPPFLLVLCWLL